MAKRKRGHPQGQYCKACGEYKANEKFFGKGHAAHIGKTCFQRSAAEQAEVMAINRPMNFPIGRVSKRFTADRISHILTMIDFDTDGVERSMELDGRKMSTLLRWTVHTLEILLWPEDTILIQSH